MTNNAPPTCTDHPRRHHAGCPNCRARSNWRARRRTRLIAYGQWQGPVDSTETRAHILTLTKQHGMSLRAIAAASGCGRSCIEKLASDQPPAKIHAKTASAVLATQPAVKPDGVDSLGTARRLQALTAIGHNPTSLGRHLGVKHGTISRLRRQWKPTVSPDVAAAVAALYDRLEGTPGTCNKARAFARQQGWGSPLAWDDNIDNPDARPEEMLTDTVTLALAGQMPADALSPDERMTVVQRLIRRRWSDRQIADLLRWTGGRVAVAHWRRYNGLAPGKTRMGPRPRTDPYRPPTPPVRLSQAKQRRAEIWAAIDAHDKPGLTVEQVAEAAGCSARTVWRRRAQRQAAPVAEAA